MSRKEITITNFLSELRCFLKKNIKDIKPIFPINEAELLIKTQQESFIYISEGITEAVSYDILGNPAVMVSVEFICYKPYYQTRDFLLNDLFELLYNKFIKEYKIISVQFREYNPQQELKFRDSLFKCESITFDFHYKVVR